MEVVNTTGEYLSDEQITLTKNGEALARVNCAGAWVLCKIAPGAYSVSAEIAGMNQESRVNVSGTGQARVIVLPSNSGHRKHGYRFDCLQSITCI